MTTGATATVKGGFWPNNGVTSLTQSSGKSVWRRRIARALATYGMMDQRALLLALDGVAPGAAALKTLGRIEANAELSGKRTIETNTIINRVSAAGDVTELNADFLTFTTRTTKGSSPVANKDGNPLGTR